MRPVAMPACSSSRTTRRSPRCSSARCAWRATTCGSPATARRRSTRRPRSFPTSSILDLGLPKLDGIEVARRLRETRRRRRSSCSPPATRSSRASRASTPAPTTTSSSPSSARSCSPACARCCAAARRAAPPRSSSATCSSTPTRTRSRRGERAIDLTQREFELLEYLMRNERIVISRQRLLDEVWGYDPFCDHEHDRGVRLEPAAQARGRWRAAAAAHDPRRGVRTPRYSAAASIRWRLAPAARRRLTLVILCGFAVVVGALTTGAIRSDFNDQVARPRPTTSRDRLRSSSSAPAGPRAGRARPRHSTRRRNAVDPRARRRRRRCSCQTTRAPNFGAAHQAAPRDVGGYRVESRRRHRRSARRLAARPICIQYARPLSDVETHDRRVRFFLAARRARRHRARPARRPGRSPGARWRRSRELTDAAREIARTRDPVAAVPAPRGRRRGRRAGAHARGDARGARRRARRDRGRARAPARSSSPTPRTSCARR